MILITSYHYSIHVVYKPINITTGGPTLAHHVPNIAGAPGRQWHSAEALGTRQRSGHLRLSFPGWVCGGVSFLFSDAYQKTHQPWTYTRYIYIYTYDICVCVCMCMYMYVFVYIHIQGLLAQERGFRDAIPWLQACSFCENLSISCTVLRNQSRKVSSKSQDYPRNLLMLPIQFVVLMLFTETHEATHCLFFFSTAWIMGVFIPAFLSTKSWNQPGNDWLTDCLRHRKCP